MPNEIKVGEYVRTNKGNIGKIVKEYTFKNGKVEYPEPQEWVLDNGYVLNEAMMFSNKEDIVKHKPKPIDLIEVGDYVNGHKIVREIWGEDDNDLYFEIEGGFGKATYIGEKNIKSIATKEQFKSVEYKIGGE